jgi:hypothetical protein
VWEGMTLADRRKQSCKTGHAEMREAVRLHPDLPYCEDCGEKLM